MQLDKLKEFIFTEIQNGIKSRKSPFHTPSFSYSNSNQPHVCCVVLREVNTDKNFLRFNSDIRCQKVKILKENPKCEMHFYCKDKKLQIRFQCIASIEFDNEYSKTSWDSMQDMSKKCYDHNKTPGELINNANNDENNDKSEYLESLITDDNNTINNGYQNFSCIKLNIQKIDTLFLNHKNHKRFILDIADGFKNIQQVNP